MTTSLKTCFKCGAEKQITEFYRHKAMADGYLGKCKECAKVDTRQNRAARLEYYTNYEKHRAMQPHRVAARYQYQQTEAGKESMRRTHAKYRQTYPERDRARVAVNNAVRDGKLTKPKQCSECGKGGRIHGHHDDYSKPLAVRWLCPACHTAWHKEHGEAINARSQEAA